MEPTELSELPIEVVNWPDDRARRDAFARAGVPRLLLVAPGAEAPEQLGVDEDWVRLPADEAEIRARVARVRLMIAHRSGSEPFVDDHRMLHRGSMAVQLTPIEASIVTSLLAHRGDVVDHVDLERRAWSSAAPSRDALDAAIYRLRRRLAGAGLYVRTVRGRGFALIVG